MTGTAWSFERYKNAVSEDIVVLHIDDDVSWLDITRERLEADYDCFDIKTTDSTSAAGNRLSDHPDGFDCIVIDLEMPEMTGIEFAKIVQERGLGIPTILYTSCGNNAVVTDAIEAGMVDHVQKSAGLDHYVLLANRIVSAVVRHRFKESSEL